MASNNEECNLTKLRKDLISNERSYPKEKNGLYIHGIIAEGKTICHKSEAKEYVLWSSDNEEIDTAYLILIGETGKGKTTLINGILNFIMGIDYHHAFRLSVPVFNSSTTKRVTESQTELLTVYKLPYVDGMAHRSNLVLIDTPGVLDTHGPGYEKLNLDRIKLFLKEQIPVENNFTGIVAEANLTNTANFDSLINGIKHIVDEQSTKTVLIATFADASKPKAFSALEKLNMKFHKKISINNGFIFTSNVDDLQEKWNEWKDQITDLMACITQTPKDNLGITLSHDEMDQLNCIHLERLDLEKSNKENKVMKMLRSVIKKVYAPKVNRSLTEISTGDEEDNYHHDELKDKEKMDENNRNLNAKVKNEDTSNANSMMNEGYETICKARFKLTAEKYNEKLEDKTSTAFAIKRKEIDDLVEDSFRRTSGKKHFKNEVKEFKKGSIIVVSEITTREEDGIADIKMLSKIIKESGINGLDQSSVSVYGTKAIHWIAYGGHLDILKDLVDLGKDIREQDELNRTPLHRAAGGNHKQICEWLLDNGSVPDLAHKDDFGRTPSDEAKYSGHSELASWLKKVQTNEKLLSALIDKDEKQISTALDAGANPNIRDKLGFPALVIAAMYSSALTKLFLQAGANVNMKTREGAKAVHWASYYGQLDAMCLLVDHKVDLHVQDNYSMTPLHWAAMGNQKEVCEWLLKQSLDPDLSHKDDFDRTPADWAQVRNHKQLYYRLKEIPKFTTTGATETSAKKEKPVRANQNRKSLENTLNQFAGLINKMIESPTIKTSGATKKSSKKKLPLKRKMKDEDISGKDADEVVASTSWQISSPPSKKMKLCKDKREAQFKEEDCKRLFKAVSKEDKHSVQTLIDEGKANVNWKIIGGITPLHHACLRGYPTIVELLISRGADIEAKDNRESTPLDWAYHCDKEEIIEILRNAGAVDKGHPKTGCEMENPDYGNRPCSFEK